MFKLYNTFAKNKEEFKSINPGKVGFYTCGPTVYDYIHIGNIKSYLTADVLRRYLVYLGYEVRHIKNITDVGHLTEDDIAQGDSGDDKLVKKALLEKKSPAEIAFFYEEYFRETEKKMNILPAHFFPRATAHIPQMIKIIATLIEKGFAYEKNGNVFFSIKKFPEYGKLSGNTLENLKIGARLEEHPDKEDPWDFALWLRAPKEHLMKFNSPWSLGYPGWHIECSAMSAEYLGDTFDIHTGGEDNIFPHHEAEIAQSECFSGKKFVAYWVHTRLLMVDGKKMSKSKNNFYRLEDILEKGYDAMALRILILSSHYRSQMNFTWESMDQAKSNFQKISVWINNLMNVSLGDSKEKSQISFTHIYQKRFEDAMNDDLNTPLALSVLYDLITETNKLSVKNKLTSAIAKEILTFWKRINKVFGLIITEASIIPNFIIDLAEKRKEARLKKDFATSDKLRNEIEKLGYLIEDLKDNDYTIKKL
ncbi:MAG: cysteine--tRNA ligase [Candidatus Moranbacteria bacterium CG_4_8_14_3_um_filter_34_16]|nr:MAG: cysteine--tRNA ligase [Candidatus Moranbacteria bacterium CG_4_8_14_3_um_filter_34_16]